MRFRHGYAQPRTGTRGQGNLELLIVASLAILFFIFSMAAFSSGYGMFKETSSALAVRESMKTISLLERGSERLAVVSMPEGIANLSVTQLADGTVVSFLLNNKPLSFALAQKTVFVPENFLSIPGKHVLRMHWVGKTAIVEKVG